MFTPFLTIGHPFFFLPPHPIQKPIRHMHLNNDVKSLKKQHMLWTKTDQQNPKLASQ
jgi:hypothetical protein